LTIANCIFDVAGLHEFVLQKKPPRYVKASPGGAAQVVTRQVKMRNVHPL